MPSKKYDKEFCTKSAEEFYEHMGTWDEAIEELLKDYPPDDNKNNVITRGSGR